MERFKPTHVLTVPYGPAVKQIPVKFTLNSDRYGVAYTEQSWENVEGHEWEYIRGKWFKIVKGVPVPVLGVYAWPIDRNLHYFN